MVRKQRGKNSCGSASDVLMLKSQGFKIPETHKGAFYSEAKSEREILD